MTSDSHVPLLTTYRNNETAKINKACHFHRAIEDNDDRIPVIGNNRIEPLKIQPMGMKNQIPVCDEVHHALDIIIMSDT